MNMFSYMTIISWVIIYFTVRNVRKIFLKLNLTQNINNVTCVIDLLVINHMHRGQLNDGIVKLVVLNGHNIKLPSIHPTVIHKNNIKKIENQTHYKYDYNYTCAMKWISFL